MHGNFQIKVATTDNFNLSEIKVSLDSYIAFPKQMELQCYHLKIDLECLNLSTSQKFIIFLPFCENKFHIWISLTWIYWYQIPLNKESWLCVCFEDDEESHTAWMNNLITYN